MENKICEEGGSQRRRVDVAVYLEGTYPYQTGGISTVVDLILRSMPEMSFALVCVVPEGSEISHAAYPLPDNVQIFRILDVPPIPVRREDFPPFLRVFSSFRFPEARIHHSHTCGLAGLAAAMARKQQSGSRMILSEHSLFYRDALKSIQQGGSPVTANEVPAFSIPDTSSRQLLERMLSAMCRHVYWNSDMVTYLDDSLRKQSEDLGFVASCTMLVPNPADIRRFQAAQVALRPGSPVRLLWLGRIVPQKDVVLAIRCAAALRKAGVSFHLSIAGPANEAPCYLEECRELVRDLGLESQVDFAGVVDPVDAFSRADALLVTSQSEAMPMVVLEAMAAGVPVCSVDVGCVRQMVGDAGIVAGGNRGGSEEKLAAGVIRLALDRGLYERASVAAIRRANAHDMDSWVSQWRTLFR